MDRYKETNNGRDSAVFLCALLCGVTFVLTLTHWFTGSGEFHLSLIPFYAWEITLFSIIILTTAVFVFYKENDISISSIEEPITAANKDHVFVSISVNIRKIQGGRLPCCSRFPLRSVILTVCGAGNVVFPFFETYRTIDNLVCLKNESGNLLALLVLKIISNILCVFFCVFQLLFVFRFQYRMSMEKLIRTIVAMTVAGNFSLCVTGILNTIWTSNTIEFYHQMQKNKNGSVSPYENISWYKQTQGDMFLKCTKQHVVVDKLALSFQKYLYQYPVEFALFSLPFLYTIWNMTTVSKAESLKPSQTELSRTISEGHIETSLTSASSSTSHIDDDSERRPLVARIVSIKPQRRICLYIKSIIMCVSRYAIIPTIVLLVGIFSLHLYTETQAGLNRENDVILGYYKTSITHSKVEKAFSLVHTIFTYAICIVCFIGFLLSRKEKQAVESYSAGDSLLLVGVTGYLLLILFETVACIKQFTLGTSAISSETISFFAKTIFHYLGIYSQIMLILKASKMKVRPSSMKNGKQLLIKGITVFVGFCNLGKWAADSFLSPTVLGYFYNLPNYGERDQKIWWALSQFLYPFAALYRIVSAVICFEACMRLRQSTS